MEDRSETETRSPFHKDRQVLHTALVTSPQRSMSFHSTRTRSRDRAVQPLPDVISEAQNNFVNLNRWSRSTTSSAHTQNHSSSSNRRMSFGGASSTFLDSPPRKLQKKAASPSSQIKITRNVVDSSSITLPLLNTLPSLQTPGDSGLSPSADQITSSPTTAQILSAAARSVDYFGGAWEDPSLAAKDFSHRRSPSISRSINLGPSPILRQGVADSGDDVAALAEEDRPRTRGHSRHRSQAGNGSAGTQGSNRSTKQPSQKVVLSKALQKAKTAVLLDNAQNFEGATEAYLEACSLLQQVMLRSSGDEDRRKLEAIRNTYTTRINELMRITPHLQDDGKALPARPESGSYRGGGFRASVPHDNVAIGIATATRIITDHSYISKIEINPPVVSASLSQRRDSLLPSSSNTLQHRSENNFELYQIRSHSRSPDKDRASGTMLNLAPPMDTLYMPPPLSPRRPLSPSNQASPSNTSRREHLSEVSISDLSNATGFKGHVRAASNESMSWLDTIDESGGSTSSSVHSRSSSLGVRRKHIRAASGATEAEFDAALDAAVEAAYADGFEPVDALGQSFRQVDDEDEVVTNVRKRVEMAKEKVRQSEREAAIQAAHDRERKRSLYQKQQLQYSPEDDYDVNDSEEEERMLEEMTRGYIMDDFEFSLQSKSALPRESDSSGFSGRTWNSSIGSNPTTAGTILSTVAEASSKPQVSAAQFKVINRTNPPPTQALPLPPLPGDSASSTPNLQGVRSRRLSGQNAKQLKIETTSKIASDQTTPSSQPLEVSQTRLAVTSSQMQPKTAGSSSMRQIITPGPSRLALHQLSRQAPSPFIESSPSDAVPLPTPSLLQSMTDDTDNFDVPRSGSPARAQSRSELRKNFSSSSLKNMKNRNLSVSHHDDGSDASPSTPMSSQFNVRDTNSRLPALPALPTPIAVAFKERMHGLPAGGMFLFNSDIHSPESPSSPSAPIPGAPIPLEPCPTEYLLRPFWLMRALYQTIAHPRGGYISAKLFIPRDVWRVKGVKIKNVEDKVSNCDFLTAALLKLAKVDTYDADAVLEEMQTLEGVLEQVQAALSKKMGNDVGVQSASGMFKDPLVGVENDNNSSSSKGGNTSSKSSSFSWRRLRSKNSGVNLSTTYTNKSSADGAKENAVIATLPMSSISTSRARFAKRDVAQVQFSGPNAHYMSALAKLFDAAQTIDQIARQVEDPGLRHADKTQVGLELCTRHAAEFFGFYICRFVLADIGLLLDKFIKRGSEWVLV